jgi:general nucleoside transport system permease protein
MLEELAFSALRIAVPLIFALMGGLLTFKAGILNIALDGFMIVGAFAAVVAAYLTGSLTIGILAGVVCSTLLAGLLAVFNLFFRAHIFIAGIAVNFIAYGLTALLLEGLLGQQGIFTSDDIPRFSRIDLPLIKEIPFVGPIFSGHTLLVYGAYLTVPVVSWLLYKTQWGLRIRIVGEAEAAAAAAGVNVDLIKIQSMLASGLFCGLAGAYLSLGYVSLFAKQMTNDRGLIAIAAIIFAKGNPYATATVALLFGLSTALSIRLPDITGIAPQLLQILPYIVTVLALVTVGIRTANSRNKHGSWRFDAS